jgi:hypothetical protein
MTAYREPAVQHQLARARAIKPGDMLTMNPNAKMGETVLVLEVKPVAMGRRSSTSYGFEILMLEIASQKKFSVRYMDTQTTSWYHHVI